MNPPFARTVGQEGDHVGVPRPAFAGVGTSDAEQEAMSARLASVYRRKRSAAGRGHAGLASYFLDLAHMKVKPGGVIAFVLPATFVVSNAWAPARELLAKHYEDIAVVSIAAPGLTDRAFSDDTAIAEVLVVATRRGSQQEHSSDSEHDEEANVRWVGLAGRPSTVAQSLEVAAAIIAHERSGRAGGELRLGNERLGAIGTGKLTDGGFAQLSELRLATSALSLLDGHLDLPRHQSLPIPIARLADLGKVGSGNAAIGVKPKSAGPIERGTGAYAPPSWLRDLDTNGHQWPAPSSPVFWAHDVLSARANTL